MKNLLVFDINKEGETYSRDHANGEPYYDTVFSSYFTQNTSYQRCHQQSCYLEHPREVKKE